MPAPHSHCSIVLLVFALSAFALLPFILHAQETQVPRQQESKPVGGGGSEVPNPNQNPDGPFRQNQVTKKVLLTYKPEPGFTENARNNDTQGVVRLRAVLASSGEVTNIVVIKGLPDGLTEKSIAAAKKIRFTPAQKDGRTVSQYIVLEYNFNFYDEQATTRAVILEMPQPDYTDEARKNRVTGKVILQVRLRRDGKTVEPFVVEGLPDGLTEKALDAAHRIKFKPAELGGQKISVLRGIEYVFSLD